MGDGTKTNYWNPGMDGVRVSIVDAASRSVVRTPIDLTNKTPAANIAHFGKVSKLSYNAGRGLSVTVSGYSYRNPSQSLPKIISTSSSKASIAAIRSYFTDEQVIRSIAGYAGMDFDTLIGGDYKLVVEPLAYLCYNGQQFAMTATEARRCPYCRPLWRRRERRRTVPTPMPTAGARSFSYAFLLVMKMK